MFVSRFSLNKSNADTMYKLKDLYFPLFIKIFNVYTDNENNLASSKFERKYIPVIIWEPY